MVKISKKKMALSLAIILAFLIAFAVPFLLLSNNQSAFPLQTNAPANNNIQALGINPSSPNPQPQPYSWWNYSYDLRQTINVTEPGYATRVNAPAAANMYFQDGTCNASSTVLAYYNYTLSTWVPILSQITNATYWPDGYLESCTLIFPCNVTLGGTSTYYLYYSDNSTVSQYIIPSPLSITIGTDSQGTTFIYNTGAISGYYQALSNDLANDDDASFQNFTINQIGLDLVPTSGTHSGIDRVDADDQGRFGLNNKLNWTINIIQNGPYQAIVQISKLSTDNFTSGSGVGGGSWGPFNKTYTFYAYSSIIAIQIQNLTPFSIPYNAIPIYDFAVTYVNSSFSFYVDSNNLGDPTQIPFVEAMAGVQPQNYMVETLSNGFGIGFLGSPAWPKAVDNATSMEYGYSPDGSGISSFLIRNDKRNTGESYINIPFEYYVVGLTGGGFSQAVNAWNQVNNNVTCSSGNATREIYPLLVNVTDAFGNPISGANVTVYNNYNSGNPIGYNTSGLTNTQGLITFALFNSTSLSQYGIQAYVNTSYWNYSSQSWYWNTNLNFTGSISTLPIQMNITTLNLTIYDESSNLLQNAGVTLNYVNTSLTSITQTANPYYANCSFYVWANQSIWLNVTFGGTLYPVLDITNYPTYPPINTTSALALLVHLDYSLTATPTFLSCVNGPLLSVYWLDNVNFSVWINNTISGIGIAAQFMSFNITGSNGFSYSANMTSTGTTGLYNANFNTTVVGLSGVYTMTVFAIPSDTINNQIPSPIQITLQLNAIPVSPQYTSLQSTQWVPSLGSNYFITITYIDTQHNQGVSNVTALSTVFGTSHINENMTWLGGGTYEVPPSTISALTPGQYVIQMNATKANYNMPNVTVYFTITPVSTLLVVPSTSLSGFYNQNISMSAVFEYANQSQTITGANLSWTIRENPNIYGVLNDTLGVGNYTGVIPAGALNASVYTVIIAAAKTNYTTQYQYLTLSLQGTPTAFSTVLVIPQIFGSSNFLLAGQLVQVENSVPFAPLLFSYTDINGNPVPNATITASLGLPVFGFGSSAKGTAVSQIGALGLSSSNYLVLVPIFGLPPFPLSITITLSAPNYQSQTISFVVSIQPAAIAIGPTRVPISTFLETFAAVGLPTALFLTYTFVKRARIPAIIKRIDELIRAISRGEKVEVKLIPREQVIAAILREDLSIVGVEPRVEKYIPVELADRIVPLLVESGMKDKEAYTMSLELKTASPVDREKLLESVGIPGETSARIIQTIEEYEEKQAPLRKPKERKPKEEAEEEPKEVEEEPKEEAEEEPKEEPKEDKEPEDLS